MLKLSEFKQQHPRFDVLTLKQLKEHHEKVGELYAKLWKLRGKIRLAA